MPVQATTLTPADIIEAVRLWLDENDGLFELYQSSHSTVAESNARVARIAKNTTIFFSAEYHGAHPIRRILITK